MTDPCGHTTSYDYKNSGRLKDKYLPNGITGTYSYNPDGDINSIVYISGTTNILNLSYPSYDNANNILTQGINGVTKTFNYDTMNQLTGVNVGGVQTEQFTYDPVGNRLTSIDNPTWTYNTDNELSGFGATTMTYDANGNMTADSSAGSSLSYDFENRLASYATASTTANYLYDPQGRRLQKTVNGVATRYLWDGATMIAELDGTNQITRLYTYNPQSMEPISTAIGCTAYFYITDHLMTPQMLTSMSGTTAWYAELSAFGTANVITSTVTNNLRFPGQYADAESGLSYNYARYYLPQTGRYLERDPLLNPMITSFSSRLPLQMSAYIDKSEQIMQLLSPSTFDLLKVLVTYAVYNPRTFNFYIYGFNNSLRYIDILGLCSCEEQARTALENCIAGCSLTTAPLDLCMAACLPAAAASSGIGGVACVVIIDAPAFIATGSCMYGCYDNYKKAMENCKRKPGCNGKN